MNEIATPTNVGPTDGLALAQDRAAFERLVLQLTGRDMAYHARNRTTGLDTAWICYRGGVAAERERCAKLCAELGNDENSRDYRASARPRVGRLVVKSMEGQEQWMQ